MTLESSEKSKSKQKSFWKIFLFILLGLGILVLAGFGYLEYEYRYAIKAIDHERYGAARRTLQKIEFYRNSEEVYKAVDFLSSSGFNEIKDYCNSICNSQSSIASHTLKYDVLNECLNIDTFSTYNMNEKEFSIDDYRKYRTLVNECKTLSDNINQVFDSHFFSSAYKIDAHDNNGVLFSVIDGQEDNTRISNSILLEKAANDLASKVHNLFEKEKYDEVINLISGYQDDLAEVVECLLKNDNKYKNEYYYSSGIVNLNSGWFAAAESAFTNCEDDFLDTDEYLSLSSTNLDLIRDYFGDYSFQNGRYSYRISLLSSGYSMSSYYSYYYGGGYTSGSEAGDLKWIVVDGGLEKAEFENGEIIFKSKTEIDVTVRGSKNNYSGVYHKLETGNLM